MSGDQLRDYCMSEFYRFDPMYGEMNNFFASIGVVALALFLLWMTIFIMVIVWCSFFRADTLNKNPFKRNRR